MTAQGTCPVALTKEKSPMRARHHLRRSVRSGQRGMTLLEIMIVIAILGLLASVIVVAVMDQFANAKVSTTRIQIKSIEQALNQYNVQVGEFPSQGEGLRALTSPPDGLRPFMKEGTKDAWGNEFMYFNPARKGKGPFEVVSKGADGQEGTDDDIRTIAAQIMDRITDPISVSGKQIRLGASVGVSFAACGSRSNIIDTLEDADIALIRAKEAGRGRCRFFEPQMRDEAVHRARMQQEITLGLQRDEFTAHFQPQIDIGTGNVIGFEALARWEHPARGTLTAGEFIGFIDSTSLAGKLDRQVLHLACLALEILERAGHSDITISVNISTEQLREPGIAGVLSDVVRRAGARPACLHLEILETTLLDSASPTIIDNIRDLAERGFPIELDDFGTGHTAISSILNFPISRIKIAGSLITGVDGDQRRQAVVHSIVELGENLNVEVLAEGMETAAEVAFLKSISCRTGQGFYLAAPVPIDELVDRIELQSTDAAATPEPDLELSDEGV